MHSTSLAHGPLQGQTHQREGRLPNVNYVILPVGPLKRSDCYYLSGFKRERSPIKDHPALVIKTNRTATIC